MLIGEVARRSGVSTRMLRHYDTLGLVRPTGRTVGNYREYAAADIRRIFHVESLRSLGLSLRQVQQALDDPAFAPADLVADLIRRTEDRLRQEQELLDRLRAVDASAPDGWQGVLRIVALLHGLNSPDAARRQQSVLTDTMPVDVLAGAVLTESDPNVAGALRWALTRAGTAGVDAVAAGLDAPDPQIRRRAVLALAAIPDDDATTLLTGALDDPAPEVRGPAALALGRRGVITALPALVAMIVDGVNDVEASELLGALAQQPAGADPILNALLAELSAPAASPAVRIRLAQALAELPPAVTRDTLHHLSRDADRTVAAIAAFAAARTPPAG
ncbi:MerR family transcriptional regulator [Actinoplanes cyaneus]|uniref:MerR family transcriptional regulator n=1 Tax=Actinoplanes cyaneus TaxID=52696 RepID=A0A919M5H6_9ACTN|nr:MerR family transcriptional regulator [Actinoplanes cyaneus]MCW2143127.1 DNA-binding transcriptional regulator, MerR family [Actinoplanes cyaneus]GID70460.1 MerR family transcriptional regulator [Actinoplanes cyaneus]